MDSITGATAPINIPEIDRIECGNCKITFERLTGNYHDLCERCDGWRKAYFSQQATSRALRQTRGQQRRRQSETASW